MNTWNVTFILEGERESVSVEVECHLAHNAPKVAWKGLEQEQSHEVGKYTVELVVKKVQ